MSKLKKVLLIEACSLPHIPEDPTIIKSHILGSMTIRHVIEKNKDGGRRGLRSGVSTTSFYGIPLSLAYIGYGVDRDRFELEHIPLIIEAYKFRLNRKNFTERVRKMAPDAVAISLNHASDINIALGMCHDIKAISADIVTIIGGVAATFSARRLIDNRDVDYILCGEGDLRFGKLLEAIFGEREKTSYLRGIYRKNNGSIEHTPDVRDFVDLQSINPVYDFLKPENYIKEGILAHVQTSRGCPYSCSFCCHTNFWGKKMRFRKPASVVREINHLSSLGADIVYFCDSTFTINKAHVVELMKLLSESEFEVPVVALETRVELIDDEMCRLMQRAGVRIVALGIEGADKEVLRKTGGKGGRGYFEKIMNSVETLSKYGIELYACFVVGLPGESEGSVMKTQKLIEQLHSHGILWADVRFAMAFPGSDIYEDPDRFGIKIRHSSPYLFYDKPGYILKNGPDEQQLIKMHREIVNLNNSYVESKHYIKENLDYVLDQIARFKKLHSLRKEIDWYKQEKG